MGKYTKTYFKHYWLGVVDGSSRDLDAQIAYLQDRKNHYEKKGWSNLYLEADNDDHAYTLFGDRWETDEEVQHRKERDKQFKEEEKALKEKAKETRVKAALSLLRRSGYTVTPKK